MPITQIPPPTVLINANHHDPGAMLCFKDAKTIIEAHAPEDIPGALQALEQEIQLGRHVAGLLSYELGAHLLEHQPAVRSTEDFPLLWFGAFEEPVLVERSALHANRRYYASVLRHELDFSEYSRRFDAVRDRISAGDIYQANLSFRSRFSFIGDPLAFYLSLWDTAQAPYCCYVDAGSWKVLSLSPELFFTIDQDRITVQPMKGTAARGPQLASDQDAKAKLSACEKNRAENVMIVDLMRNDVGRVARAGTVLAHELFTVHSYPTLHTMVSTVTAQLKPHVRRSELLGALFPAGSITGAPKLSAMQIIRELECSPRGVYCGAMGYFAPSGNALFNVAIRTITLHGGRGAVGIGGAVVADSNPADEHAECLLKARFFERAREPLRLFETLRWQGVFHQLDKHLDRMAHSASRLGMPFDASAAIRVLHGAVGMALEGLRVRLELDEDGHFDCSVGSLPAAAIKWRVALSDQRVDSTDELLQHKTTSRRLYDEEWTRLHTSLGVDEVLFLNQRAELTEGSRTNLFLQRGRVLLTPPVSSGLLNGILRRTLVDAGRCEESVLTVDDLRTADACFMGNSLRGMIVATVAS